MPESNPTRPLDAETIERLKSVSTATLSTQLYRRGFKNLFLRDVRPLRSPSRMVGTAFTLRFIPVREDLADAAYDNRTNVQRIAIESVGPGEVLVIDARGETAAGSFGNILCARVKARGAAGIVTDGSVRDAPSIRSIDLPSYSRSQDANLSVVVHHPSEINVPIACGGVAVLPGDVIVGDDEGVIVIPRALADEVARDAVEQEQREAFIFSKVAAGSSIHGVYPPNEETLKEYEAWRAAQGEGG